MKSSVKINLGKLMYRDGQMNETDLSKKTGVPQSTIHRILSGYIKESKPSTLKPIARYFGVSLAQLLGEEPLQGKLSSKVNKDTKIGMSTPSRLIPIISWENVLDWKKKCKTYQPKGKNDWVCTTKKLGAYAFALRLEHKMSALGGFNLEPGTEIVVDPARKPKNLDYVIVDDGVNTTMKQLLVANGNYTLVTLNAIGKTKPMHDSITIYGVVCQIIAYP